MTHKELLEQGREHFRMTSAATSDWRIAALADQEFDYGGDYQWERDALSEREGKPTVTINKIPQFTRQITGDQRQNPTTIKINPVDDDSDPEVAKVFQGIIRHIETSSGAEAAYETAFEHCVKIGRGWWRVNTEYDDDETFDLKLVIDRIINPFTVYEDPRHEKADASDMKFCFVSDHITHKEHERKYPGKSIAGLQEIRGIGDEVKEWAVEGKIRVAEYFHFETKKHQLVIAETTVPSTQEPLKVMVRENELEQMELPEGSTWNIVKRREVETTSIKKAIINGVEVLEETDWPGKYIPLIPVTGDERLINGKRDYRGIIRDLIDPSRVVNYMTSKELEIITQAAYTPWVGPAGFAKGREDQWSGQNRKPQDYIEYEVMKHGDKPLPPPQRVSVEPPIQAVSMAGDQAGRLQEDIAGFHGPSMGRRDRADSGVAIKQLQRTADTGSYYLVDNLSRSHRHTGRILVDLIPIVYDTVKRIARIIGPDENEQRVQITSQPGEKALLEGEGKEGKIEKIFNVAVGKYDVVVETGPSHATKRQEALAGLLELTSSYPQIMEIAGDLLVKNMDTPFAQELSERLKKALRPDLLEEGDEPMPAFAQSQITQLTEQLQQGQEQMQAMQTEYAEMKSKVDQKTIENETKVLLKKMDIGMEQFKIRFEAMAIDKKIDSQEMIEFNKAEAALAGKTESASVSPGNGAATPNVGG